MKKIWTILLSDTFTSPKLYLGGKHGKAVAVFTIVQQQAESKNVSNNELFDKQPKITHIALKMHLVLPTQKKRQHDIMKWGCVTIMTIDKKIVLKFKGF